MENKKPKYFLIFKIIGIIGILIVGLGIYLAVTGFGDFESSKFMVGTMISPFGLMIGVSCSLIGFRPEIAKMRSKTIKYIQEENKDDLTAIANNTAEIMEGAVSKTASAVKEGFVQDTIFCKHCGAKIDADSKFCNRCGKEQ